MQARLTVVFKLVYAVLMNVILPAELQAYVDSLVRQGEYAGSSEVIQAALLQHRVNRPAAKVIVTPALEKLLDEGMEDLDQAVTTEQLRRQR